MTTRNAKAALTASFPAVLDLFTLTLSPAHAGQLDPLPSWNDGPPKKAILQFVAALEEAK